MLGAATAASEEVIGTAAFVRSSSAVISCSRVLCNSLVAFLNSAIPRPIDRPSSGNLRGPKTTRAITKMTMSSGYRENRTWGAPKLRGIRRSSHVERSSRHKEVAWTRPTTSAQRCYSERRGRLLLGDPGGSHALHRRVDAWGAVLRDRNLVCGRPRRVWPLRWSGEVRASERSPGLIGGLAAVLVPVSPAAVRILGALPQSGTPPDGRHRLPPLDAARVTRRWCGASTAYSAPDFPGQEFRLTRQGRSGGTDGKGCAC